MLNIITSSQPSSWSTTSQRLETPSQHIVFSIQETNDIIPAATNENVWEELSQTYDVRNATFDEMKEIANSLHKAGAISLKELMSLTFDYGRATDYIKQAAQLSSMPVAKNFSMYETNADKFGQRDWIAEFSARATKDLQYGNLVGHSTKTKILNILKQLEI
ncbi:hypothetical protein [Lysinibacillus piscis]|uniref:Uncharacterized protein n=1 Tax=Lysinibacillus piscis TaxID=2518931 RepID=A0ABQ5NKZ1_9BACI|nr:hypothetical protein [Lysinibacillus sp. KH24]GLC88761.1 hypothetical protein LYSBPC_18880 [Lysinibacillus sp. KH24]